jgi:hypothetical protein
MQGGVHHHTPPAHHYGGSGFESTAAVSPQVFIVHNNFLVFEISN